MDDPGAWIPDPNDLDLVQKARFDNASAKRCTSVHLYIKNIEMQGYFKANDETSTALPMGPRDYLLYTYANKYSPDLQQDYVTGDGMKNYGQKLVLRRGQKAFHRILKSKTGSRSAVADKLSTLSQESWKAFTDRAEFYGFAGEKSALGTRLNLDWFIMPTYPYTEQLFQCIMLLKFDVVVATRWKLRGSETGRTQPTISRMQP